MNRVKTVCICMLFVLVSIAGCNLSSETPRTSDAQAKSLPTVDVERQSLIQKQMNATAIPLPSDPLLGGFSFYEDNNLPPGYDPLFAVCKGKVAKLNQNGDGWKIEGISLEQLAQYPDLKPTGQRSDYMHYVYLPTVGEIHLVDDNGIDQKLVQAFHNEYDPEYWIWAWSSLMFIKDCHLRVFYIRPDGTSHFYRYDF